MPGYLPRLWVTPAFHGLDFDSRRQFVSVVYAYYIKQDARATIVKIHDSRTGKQIGTYSVSNPGLKMD